MLVRLEHARRPSTARIDYLASVVVLLDEGTEPVDLVGGALQKFTPTERAGPFVARLLCRRAKFSRQLDVPIHVRPPNWPRSPTYCGSRDRFIQAAGEPGASRVYLDDVGCGSDALTAGPVPSGCR